jgi:hypothetical protein
MALLLQPSFAKGEVNPELFGRVDTSAYKIGLATARNVVIRTTGGAINRAGLEFIGMQIDMANPSRFRRFRFNVSDTYMLEFGAHKMRVIRDDAHVLEAQKTINSVTQASPMVVEVPSHGWSVGDDIEFTITAGMQRLNARRLRVGAVPDASHISMIDIITGDAVDATTFAAFVTGTAARVYTLATPYAQADLTTLKFVQSANVLTITHPGYPEGTLTRTGDAAWTLTNPTFAPAIAAPTGVSVTPITTGSTTAAYVVTVTSASTGEESLPSVQAVTTTGNVTASNTVTWSASADALLYSIYKAVNGVFGFVGTTPDLSFTENNIAPDLATTPPAAGNPFAGAGNYPACATYYQQRLVRAGSYNHPDTLNYSKTANFYNFSTSTPSQADDAIKARLTSREVNVVKHMVPVKDLIVFTAGGEWRINSSGNAFSTATMQQLSQSTWGSSDLEPIVIGQTTIFVPENKISVRSFAYTYVSDAYQGNELTLLSAHLFKTYALTDWGYSRAPDPIIYGVRADGRAVTMTFQEEQQVTAWARWDTLGAFEAVDVVRPNSAGPDEMPYFGIRRTVNGHTVRYIERMHTRRYTDVRDCFFVDSGLTFDHPIAITNIAPSGPVVIAAPGHGLTTGQHVDVYDIQWVPNFDDKETETQPNQLNTQRFIVQVLDSTNIALTHLDGSAISTTGWNAYASGGTLRVPTQTVTGLDHLEGRTVQALADGNHVADLVVTRGAVTLPYAASRIHVGLKYISDIETLDLEAPQGTIQGKMKRAVSVTVRYNQSRGMFIGQTPAELLEVKQRQDEALGDPTALFSGDEIKILGSDWNTHGRIFLRQRYPLPMDILMIEPNMDIEP